ncbi:SAM-dependent methyltransferase [Amycolatopsis sp. NPDC005232]|uniref:SAM-dependent methyltransferase n=1 Tax=Amycolatopsis sp. NPDC005232 TaxID=3157027 RepID=UPI0033AB4FCA
MTAPRLPEGVGLTALIASYARAQESRRRDRLFADSLAEQFVARVLDVDVSTAALPPLGPAREEHPSEFWKGLSGLFAGRTGFYDRYLTERLAAGCRQVVLLGAGLDSRAYRLAFPADTVVYELDSAQVLAFKERLVAEVGAEPAVKRVAVAADLREDWRRELLAAGFDAGVPTAWMAEGLLMYFEPDQADAFLGEIGGLSAAGSTLAGEYLNRRTRMSDIPTPEEGDRAMAEVFVSVDRGGPAAWPPAAWLATRGWTGDGPDLVEEFVSSGRGVPVLFDPRKEDPLRLHLFAATRNA